jgi:hypothetical protein
MSRSVANTGRTTGCCGILSQPIGARCNAATTIRRATAIKNANGGNEDDMTESERIQDRFDFAHRKATELATQCADPMRQRGVWETCYWITMQGYGFRQWSPYLP